eukprot:m.25130 g.25130  ORF g.25130 m.25130 type:complete len:317 (-) comp7758_c0_seq1:1135-2085(-)
MQIAHGTVTGRLACSIPQTMQCTAQPQLRCPKAGEGEVIKLSACRSLPQSLRSTPRHLMPPADALKNRFRHRLQSAASNLSCSVANKLRHHAIGVHFARPRQPHRLFRHHEPRLGQLIDCLVDAVGHEEKQPLVWQVCVCNVRHGNDWLGNGCAQYVDILPPGLDRKVAKRPRVFHRAKPPRLDKRIHIQGEGCEPLLLIRVVHVVILGELLARTHRVCLQFTKQHSRVAHVCHRQFLIHDKSHGSCASTSELLCELAECVCSGRVLLIQLPRIKPLRQRAQKLLALALGWLAHLPKKAVVPAAKVLLANGLSRIF